MELSKPLRSLSTAVRFFRDEGPRAFFQCFGEWQRRIKKSVICVGYWNNETLLDRLTEIDRSRLSPTNKESRPGEGSPQVFTSPYVDGLSFFLDQFKEQISWQDGFP
jgi:hypothetical protein